MKHEDAKDLTRCQGPRIADPSEAVPESEASSITVGPATIVLNLEPMPVPSLVFHDDQVVNLRNFLAYSQPFTYTITPGFEIHGSYNGKPASFLTYYVRLVPNRSTQPIQLANLAVVFGRSRTEEAINVVAYAPGRPAPKLERTTEFQKKEKVNELSGGGQAYGAHLGARHTSATTTEKDKQYAGLIEAWAVYLGWLRAGSAARYWEHNSRAVASEDHRDDANSARWSLEGNRSQNWTALGEATVAILLLRPTETFLRR